MDLLLTITLMAILASIGAPVLYPALVDFRLSAAAEQVLGAVDYARSRAVLSGTETRVTFDPGAETVLVEERRLAVDFGTAPGAQINATVIETKSYQPVQDPLDKDGDYLVVLSKAGWSGAVDLSSANFGGSPSVVFDRRGVPSAGGTVRLESSGKKIDLTLDPASGRMAR